MFELKILLCIFNFILRSVLNFPLFLYMVVKNIMIMIMSIKQRKMVIEPRIEQFSIECRK